MDLIQRDGSQPVHVGELLGESPHGLRVAEQPGAPLGRLAPEGVVGLSARDRPTKLLVGHALFANTPDLAQDLGLSAREIRRTRAAPSP